MAQITREDRSRILQALSGVAMRIHNSPRVTHDIDLAVRTPDVNRIIDVLYSRSYFLVTEIQTDSVLIKQNPEDAKTWIEKRKAGSASFLQTRNPLTGGAVPWRKGPSNQARVCSETAPRVPSSTLR